MEITAAPWLSEASLNSVFLQQLAAALVSFAFPAVLPGFVSLCWVQCSPVELAELAELAIHLKRTD